METVDPQWLTLAPVQGVRQAQKPLSNTGIFACETISHYPLVEQGLLPPQSSSQGPCADDGEGLLGCDSNPILP